MNLLRVWPIVCQFGVGAVLCLFGLWCGLRGKYLDLRVREDRWLVVTVAVGFLLLLALVCGFTFLAPTWANPPGA